MKKLLQSLCVLLVLSGVLSAAPAITSFTCSTGPCTAGSTLSWTTTGTTEVYLVTMGNPGTATSVAASGSTTVSPAYSQIYQLQARDSTTPWGLVTQEILVVAGGNTLAPTFAANLLSPNPSTMALTRTAVSGSFPAYSTWEGALTVSGSYSNAQEEVIVQCTFTAPSLKTYTVGATYDGGSAWRIRFAPMETGTYTYSYVVGGPSSYAIGSGTFTTTAGTSKGYLAINPANSKGFVTAADGKAFYPIGIQGQKPTVGGTTAVYAATRDRVAPDPIYSSWVSSYGAAGFNFNRCNSNCMQTAYMVTPTAINGGTVNQAGPYSNTGANNYNVANAQANDLVMATHWYYGWHSAFNDLPQPYYLPTTGLNPSSTGYDVFANPVATMAFLKAKQYELDRLGPFADIWELINEDAGGTLTTAWLNTVGTYIHQHDPYGHLVSVSPNNISGLSLASIDIVQPHYYNSNPWPSASLALAGQEVSTINPYQSSYPGKPMYMGESGNAAGTPDGDPTWHQRHRIQLWSLWTQGVGAVQWASYAGDGTCCQNAVIFVGDYEREQTAVFSNFVKDFDGAAVPATITVTPSGTDTVSAWALRSSNDIGAYLFHTNNNTTAVSGTVTVNVPANGMRGYWMDPATGVTLGTFTTAGTGNQTYTIPAGFVQDIVLRITTNAAPVISISPTGLPGATQAASYSQTLTASGGTAPYTFSLASGSLPDGMTLSNVGVISGFPTADYPGGKGYIFTVQVTDSASHTVTYPYSIQVANVPNVVAVTERAGNAATNYPLQFGRMFGDTSAYMDGVKWSPQIGICTDNTCGAISSWLTTQVDVKNYFASGYAKYAIFTTLIPSLPANGTVYLTFRNANAIGTATTLTTAQMAAAGYNFNAAIQGTANSIVQSASALTMLNNGNYTVWTGSGSGWNKQMVAQTIVLADQTGGSYDFGWMNKRYTALAARVSSGTQTSIQLSSGAGAPVLPAMLTMDYEHICVASIAGNTVTTGAGCAGGTGATNGRGWTAQYSVSGISRASNIVTVTTATPHALVSGISMTLAGDAGCATDPAGTFTVSTVTETTFTYTQAGPNESCSGGTVTQASFGGGANHYAPTLATWDATATTLIAAPDIPTKSIRPSFIATFWPGSSAVKVKAVAENASTTAWTDQTYDLAVTVGNASPQTVYTKSGVPHAAGSRWAVEFNNQAAQTWTVSTPSGNIGIRKETWIGSVPTLVAINPGLQYLIAANAIPNYDTSKSISESVMANDWSILINGTVGSPHATGQEIMDSSDVCWGHGTGGWGNGGAQPWDGPYPMWQVRYLYSGDIREQIISRTCDNQTGDFSFHVRENASGKNITPASGQRCSYQCAVSGLGRVASVTNRPTWTLLGNPGIIYSYTNDVDDLQSGGLATRNMGSNNIAGYNTNDSSHEPDPASLEYLLTGDYYFLEEMQFLGGFAVATANGAATSAYSGRGPTGSEGAGGYNASEIRALAWTLRAYTQAAVSSPDNTPERSYFEALVSDVIAAEEGARCGTLGSGGSPPSWCSTRAYAGTAMDSWGASTRAAVNGTKAYPAMHQWVRNPNDTGTINTFCQDQYGMNYTVPNGTITAIDSTHVTVNDAGDLAALNVGSLVGVFCTALRSDCTYKVYVTAISGSTVTLSSGVIVGTAVPWLYSPAEKTCDSQFSAYYLMYSLGRSHEQGYGTQNLRDWFAPYFVGLITDSNSNPRLAFTGRYPVERSSDGNYFTDYAGIKSGYDPAWQALASGYNPSTYGAAGPPTGYAALAQTAISYSTNVTSGGTAWNWINANVAGDSAYNGSPQWAILPRGVVSAAPACSITTMSLPGGTVGAAYSQTLGTANSTAPLTWSLLSGTLPAGLTLGSSTGIIGGTPTTAGTSSFTPQYTDAAACNASRALSVTISAGSSLVYRGYRSSGVRCSGCR